MLSKYLKCKLGITCLKHKLIVFSAYNTSTHITFSSTKLMRIWERQSSQLKLQWSQPHHSINPNAQTHPPYCIDDFGKLRVPKISFGRNFAAAAVSDMLSWPCDCRCHRVANQRTILAVLSALVLLSGCLFVRWCVGACRYVFVTNELYFNCQWNLTTAYDPVNNTNFYVVFIIFLNI